MNKLRAEIVLFIDLFLVLLLGGILLFYSLFADNYYISRKKHQINEAYAFIETLDLSELGNEDEETFLPLAESSYTVIICDAAFQTLYSSNAKSNCSMLQDQIRKKADSYTEKAEAGYFPELTGQPISLRGLISQDDGTFYVLIHENTRTLHSGIRYARQILGDLLLLAIFSGTIFALLLSEWITRPLAQIRQLIQRMMNNDFSKHLPEQSRLNELGELSSEINLMEDKIQQNINDLNNYNYLLLRQNRDMAEFEDMRKKLVSNITHELKTPLAIISSQVELLQYEYDETKKDYYFTSILEETDKMSRLISSILQNSRMENKIQQASLRWTSLSDLLLDLKPKYESWLASLKIRFTAFIEEDCMAYLDPQQIEQAVNNYMMNATRYTKPGRSVRLSLSSTEDSFYLSVYNDGPRLPEAELTKVWTGFYQSGEKRKNGSTEIGMGLYIVKDIMNHHQGSCGALNREAGVEFWMCFPKNPVV